MISVEQREKIRRAYFVEEKSIRQVARELKCSRPTVRKAIASAESASYTLTVSRAAPVLGPYKERIRELLAENERLPRKQRYTGHKIYQIIQKEGYTGCESTVRGYIARQRREKKRPKVYIPLEFDPGTDAQVDWGEGLAIIAGQRVTVQLFYMRLCYSRKLFMMAFPSQKQEAFFEGHVRAFHYAQGIPRRISYDNLKKAVKRVLEGRNRQVKPSSSFAATTCSRATSARQARDTRKAEWKMGWASPGATSWCPCLRWLRSRRSTITCWLPAWQTINGATTRFRCASTASP